jgi:hypothetical protein
MQTFPETIGWIRVVMPTDRRLFSWTGATGVGSSAFNIMHLLYTTEYH